MRKRRKSLLGLSILEQLRWRFRIDGADGLGGGTASTAAAVETADVPPVNGGPDRDYDSLANATVNDPVNQPANPGAAPPALRQPADPNQRAGVTPTATPAATATAAQEWQSIREAATAQGFRFDGTVTDDRTALNFLLQAANRNSQADYHAQLGRQLAPHAEGIQQYLRGQQSPAAVTPARQPWEAPEFDQRWAALVDRDPATGVYIAKQGVPPDIATKVNAYAEWKQKFDLNPAATINGMVEARAQEVATRTFRDQYAAIQRENDINSIVQENAGWMYQVDQGGQPLRDYTGAFIPTPVGAAYMTQLKAVKAMGVGNPRQQDQLAKQLVRGQIALAQQQQAQAATQQAANPGTQQAVNQPNRNPLQALPPSTRQVNPAATDPSEVGLSLMERMRRDLAAEGVTDSDIFQNAQQ